MIAIVRCIRPYVRKAFQIYYQWKVRTTCEAYELPLRVNFPSSVSRKTRLGKNVNFNGMSIIGNGRVTIGDNFHSGSGCLMISSSHKYDGGNAIPYDSGAEVELDISIGANVWFGSRVIVLGGISIGEGAIIQAGSVVVSSIPDCAIAGGHPARVFKYRDVAHYERLKAEKRFF